MGKILKHLSKYLILFVMLIIFTLFPSGCGKKGDPVPPRIQSLTVDNSKLCSLSTFNFFTFNFGVRQIDVTY